VYWTIVALRKLETASSGKVRDKVAGALWLLEDKTGTYKYLKS